MRVVVHQVFFYFPLVRVLGLFDDPPQVSSGGAVKSFVPHLEGQASSSNQGLDFLCHPGLPVWKDPDASALCDVIHTAPDVEGGQTRYVYPGPVLQKCSAPCMEHSLAAGREHLKARL
ncbi:hypothetical protein AMECASPLE_033296 [Ameca splendens]|uniref:Uncharacterized protein n=1 Tax=Ameca splendens TaxID=208324 RepID=A0ABV1A271_9TELE